MTAVKAWVGNVENDASSSEGIPDSLRQTLIHSICLNSTGTVAPAKVWPLVHFRISVLHVQLLIVYAGDANYNVV